MDHASEMVMTVVGLVVGWVAKVIMSTKVWKRIREQAIKELETPGNGIDDPESAVESALISIERKTIRKQATLLPPMNGSNGHQRKKTEP